MGTHYFVGIGISEYDNFPNLPNAKKDVIDVFKLLQTKYQFTKESSKILLDQEATRENIISLFNYLTEKIGENDSLLIYFSGHGHVKNINNTKRGFWLPVNAHPSNNATYIRNTTIREFIADIKSRHTLLISDACFSGSIFERGLKRLLYPVDKLYRKPSRWGLTSGRHDEYVSDGPPGTNSPFAKSLIDVLKENEKDKLSVSVLITDVIPRTRYKSQQIPEGNPLFKCGHDGGEFIFFKKNNEITPPTTTKHSVNGYS